MFKKYILNNKNNLFESLCLCATDEKEAQMLRVKTEPRNACVSLSLAVSTRFKR